MPAGVCSWKYFGCNRIAGFHFLNITIAGDQITMTQ